MTYTEQELQKISDNLHLIEEYLRNLSKQIPKRNAIQADFGKTKAYAGKYYPEPEHSIYVRANGDITFRTGGLYLGFSDETKGDNNDSIYTKGRLSYGVPIILHWQEIKARLNTQLAGLVKELDAINNFQI